MERLHESQEEMNLRFTECEKIIESKNGQTISQENADYIYELSKGGFRTLKQKTHDNKLAVTMQRKIDEHTFGKSYTFLVDELK